MVGLIPKATSYGTKIYDKTPTDRLVWSCPAHGTKNDTALDQEGTVYNGSPEIISLLQSPRDEEEEMVVVAHAWREGQEGGKDAAAVGHKTDACNVGWWGDDVRLPRCQQPYKPLIHRA